MSDSVSPIKYFLSGGFGGVCTVVAGHPLDTIKVVTLVYISVLDEESNFSNCMGFALGVRLSLFFFTR